MDNIEEWVSVYGYEGLYEISNLGNVRSLDRKIKFRNGKTCFYKGMNIKPTKGHYRYVVLSKQEINPNKRKWQTVCSLVMKSFISERPYKHEVNHINGIKTDDRLCNLEWVTKAGNAQHAHRLGLSYGPAKKIVRSDGRKYKSILECANEMNSNSTSIIEVLKGRQKHHKGFTFYYERH